MTKFISKNTDVACIQLEINGIYRDPENEKEFSALVASLTEIIEYFAFCDW